MTDFVKECLTLYALMLGMVAVLGGPSIVILVAFDHWSRHW